MRLTETEYFQRMVTGAQVRAARGLLDKNQRELAEMAGVPLSSVKSFEAGRNVRLSVARDIEAALSRAGVLFLDPGDVRPGGRGLRLRENGVPRS